MILRILSSFSNYFLYSYLYTAYVNIIFQVKTLLTKNYCAHVISSRRFWILKGHEQWFLICMTCKNNYFILAITCLFWIFLPNNLAPRQHLWCHPLSTSQFWTTLLPFECHLTHRSEFPITRLTVPNSEQRWRKGWEKMMPESCFNLLLLIEGFTPVYQLGRTGGVLGEKGPNRPNTLNH